MSFSIHHDIVIEETVHNYNLAWQCSLIQNPIADFYNLHFLKCMRNFDLDIIEYWIKETTELSHGSLARGTTVPYAD